MAREDFDPGVGRDARGYQGGHPQASHGHTAHGGEGRFAVANRPRPAPKVQPDGRHRGITNINPNINVNVNPNTQNTQGGWGKFVTKMRGWNEDENRPNTQREYEDMVQNRRNQSSIDRIRETRDTKYANDPRGWDKSPLKDRLAGLEKGQWERMSAMGMPTDTVYPGERQGIGAADVANKSGFITNKISKEAYDKSPEFNFNQEPEVALSGAQFTGDKRDWQRSMLKNIGMNQDQLDYLNKVNQMNKNVDNTGAGAFYTYETPQNVMKEIESLNPKSDKFWGGIDPDKIVVGDKSTYAQPQEVYDYINKLQPSDDYNYGKGTIGIAEGGLIGSVGGMSRPKYQEGNMVGAEMEGAEMEGAMMQSQEVIKELYDALIAQGLSPQEAMEKIKQIIASSQAQEPESPMMAEEFPGQEFGRTPAAFGGIMDTYTGRRKYGLGSFIKKAFKKVKKLASSKLGKLALMYTAGTYLGGTQALSGQMGGAGTFAQRLKNPKLLANFLKPQQWGTAGSTGKGLSGAVSTAGQVPPISYAGSAPLSGSTISQANLINPIKELTKTQAKNLLQRTIDKIPGGAMTAIGLPAAAAGLYTAKMPIQALDDTTSEYDTKKSDFDKYLASLEGDYRVPENLRLAQGGRIGRQEGGLMDLGGMEKDYRNDGGFVPIGGQEKADDVPARLSRNEFVFTADAVRNAGGGDIDKGAEVMENVMKNLEGGGQISEESQGQGAQEMFETSERLSEVI